MRKKYLQLYQRIISSQYVLSCERKRKSDSNLHIINISADRVSNKLSDLSFYLPPVVRSMERHQSHKMIQLGLMGMRAMIDAYFDVSIVFVFIQKQFLISPFNQDKHASELMILNLGPSECCSAALNCINKERRHGQSKTPPFGKDHLTGCKDRLYHYYYYYLNKNNPHFSIPPRNILTVDRPHRI